VIGDVPYVHQLLEVYVSKLVRLGPPPQGRPSGVLRYSIFACLNPASGARAAENSVLAGRPLMERSLAALTCRLRLSSSP
jgi:hypothetical protein